MGGWVWSCRHCRGWQHSVNWLEPHGEAAGTGGRWWSSALVGAVVGSARAQEHQGTRTSPLTTHSHWEEALNQAANRTVGPWGLHWAPRSFQNVPFSITAHWFGQCPTGRNGRLSSPPLQRGMSFQRVTDDFLFGLVSLNWADAHKEANPWQPTAWGVSAPRRWVMLLFCSEPLSGPHRPE